MLLNAITIKNYRVNQLKFNTTLVMQQKVKNEIFSIIFVKKLIHFYYPVIITHKFISVYSHVQVSFF